MTQTIKEPSFQKIFRTKIQEVLEKYDADSKVRKYNSKKLIIFASILGILYSLFHLYTTFNPLPTLLMRSIHLFFAMGLVFLLYPTYGKQGRDKIPVYDWLLFGLCLVSCGYLFMEF